MAIESKGHYCVVGIAPVSRPFGLLQLGNLLLSYAKLMKLRIVGMSLTTFSMGTLLAGGFTGWYSSFDALLGTGLLAGGACVLNQYFEREHDALMERTNGRPISHGQISSLHALLLGIILILTGSATLLLRVNGLTAFLGLLSVFLYLCVYTPVKRLSWICTPIGAVAGAIPPLMGWASVSAHMEAGAWFLFSILFFWQHVHFYAIAWIYKEDYRRGGFPMLPVVDKWGLRTVRQMIFASVALVCVSGGAALLGGTGSAFVWGSLAAGVGVLVSVLAFGRLRSRTAARWVVLASISYLPFLFGMIIVDHL